MIAASSLKCELDSCLTRPVTLSSLRTLLALLVKFHFSDGDNFGLYKEELECLTTQEGSKGPVYFGVEHAFDPKNPSPRPAVWTTMEESKLNKVSIDNRAYRHADNSGAGYTKLQDVLFVFTSVHDQPEIALMMSESISDFFMGVRPHLMQTMNLSMLEVQSISKIRPINKVPERHFEVDVRLQVMFSSTISVNIESHRLKKFALDIQPV